MATTSGVYMNARQSGVMKINTKYRLLGQDWIPEISLWITALSDWSSLCTSVDVAMKTSRTHFCGHAVQRVKVYARKMLLLY